ncbi:MAG: hypothetical protein EOO50_09525 [Flavobacterium sp.]|uniref:hypothetical protein n=1 Tax=Flavobacterium sp. TaxID=239 RepID=UPI0011F8F330|nr:hypothetical protein [Flavobacterium sp.]RZJ66456.1 MAG: hypothetical protein EOO50_09525 [Flavobacterium sp.]
MKKILLLLLSFSLSTLYAQLTPTVSSEEKLSIDYFAGFDNFGWRYYVKDNTFFKEKDGRKLQYQNIGLGKIKRADILNPMNLVLFYEDFNTAVFLDNQLNEIRKVNFSDYLPEPIVAHAIGNAAQNRLWIFNTATMQIGLYDYLKNTFVSLTQPLRGNVVCYETDFNHFRWVDENGDAFRCDLFGKIATLGRVPAVEGFRFVSDTSGLYLSQGNLHYVTFDGNTQQVIDLGKKSPSGFWYGGQNLAIFTPDGISIYNLKLP